MIYNRIFFFFFAESVIAQFAIQGELGVGSNWTQYHSRSQTKEIDFEYRVTCAQHYYGVGCGTLCRERDDDFGHIACSASGQKICLSGWQGEYCTKRKCFTLNLSLMINSFVWAFVYLLDFRFLLQWTRRK